MHESEKRRTAIVQRLLNLNLSTQKELNDIVKLAAVICKTPVALITLLDKDTQYIAYKTGTTVTDMPVKDAFCRYTIQQDHLLEIKDTLLDNRFKNNILVTAAPHVRYYAGAPLKTQSGDKLGGLCVLDIKPNVLNEDQQQMLEILSNQVTTILEFELSLKALKEEVANVQDSEMKLKSIFESSPTSFILLNTDMRVIAYNKAAEKFVLLHNDCQTAIQQDILYTTLLPDQDIPVFLSNFSNAVGGEIVQVQQTRTDIGGHELWWEVKFNPVYNADGDITGITLDASDISERIRFKKAIIEQNRVLREIARVQSHEIRHPLVNMMSLVHLLESDTEKDRFGEYLSLLKAELHNLDQRIKNIVSLTA